MSWCSIILVHGTWGRGFFPKGREVSLLPPNKRWWFEEGSQFHAGLDTALESASLDWPIRAFLWSGANSVHDRDCAARELSQQLRKDLQDPDATAVIIAHSHGGNVALRALQHLNSMADRIRVVTLATPFLRVFARRSLQLPLQVKFLVWMAIWLILLVIAFLPLVSIAVIAGLSDSDWVVYLMVAIVLVLAGVATFFIGQWLNAVFGNARAALAIEEKVHYDPKDAAASRVLVIRGVDDEASLSLAAGSIASRLSHLVLVVAIPVILTMSSFFLFLGQHFAWAGEVWVILMLCVCLCALIFFFLPGAFKSFFGREFLVNALVCDVAVDLGPDTLGQVEVITLRPVYEAASSVEFPSERLFSLRWFSEMMRIGWEWQKSASKAPFQFQLAPGVPLSKSYWRLRHGIYDHPHCVDEIVRWLRRVT